MSRYKNYHGYKNFDSKDPLNVFKPDGTIDRNMVNSKFIKGDPTYGYASYPQWLANEKLERKENPDPRYFVASITISFLKPDGEEVCSKYYPWQKKPLTLDDFIKAVKMCEDRHLIFIPKAGYLSELTEITYTNREQDVIHEKYRNFANHKKAKFFFNELNKTKEEKENENSEANEILEQDFEDC